MTTTQPPTPKRRTFNPTTSSHARLFTRTSSEQAGERYGIEDDTTWKVFGVGARIRQNVTTGYQTSPTFSPPLHTTSSHSASHSHSHINSASNPTHPGFFRTISGNPVQDRDFQEPGFLNPSIRTEAGDDVGGTGGSDSEGGRLPGLVSGSASGSGSGSGSSFDSLEMGGGAGSGFRAGAGFFGDDAERLGAGGAGRRTFGRHASVPAHLYRHPQPSAQGPEIFESSNQLLMKAHWQAEQSKLDDLVRHLRGRRKGELGGFAEVRVVGLDHDQYDHQGGAREDEGMVREGDEGMVDGVGMWGEEVRGSRGTKRVGARFVGSGAGARAGAAGVGEDDSMGSDTETETDEMDTGANAGINEFGIDPSFIRFDRLSQDDSTSTSSNVFRGGRRELRPTKSLPARVFAGSLSGSSASSSSSPTFASTTKPTTTTPSTFIPTLSTNNGPIAAPFTSGFFTPAISAGSISTVKAGHGTGMQVDSVVEEDGEEDGFGMDEAFGDEVGRDVFGKIL